MVTRFICDVLFFFNSLFMICFGNTTNYKYKCNIYIYIFTFPVFHGVQGQPMLAADPHSFGTATMATRYRWPVKQNNHYPTLSSAPLPRVTFDELNSLYWKFSQSRKEVKFEWHGKSPLDFIFCVWIFMNMYQNVTIKSWFYDAKIEVLFPWIKLIHAPCMDTHFLCLKLYSTLFHNILGKVNLISFVMLHLP